MIKTLPWVHGQSGHAVIRGFFRRWPHLPFRQAGDVAPQGVDKQSLREFGQHGFAADPSRRCFSNQGQNPGCVQLA